MNSALYQRPKICLKVEVEQDNREITMACKDEIEFYRIFMV